MDAKFFDYTGDNRVISKEINGVLLDSAHYSSITPLASVASLQPFRPLSELTGEIELEYNATIFAANYCMLNFAAKFQILRIILSRIGLCRQEAA